MLKRTTEEFIELARKVHGDKYDYSNVEYKSCFEKICVNCPKHGKFYITPANFLYGQGCKRCGIEKHANERKMPLEEFIKKSKEKYGDKYDYSKVEYVNCDTKVCIICPEHGEFWQTPYKHLISNIGCHKCAENSSYTTDEFVEKAKKIHGNKYDYSKTIYTGAFNKICIICPEHGEFWQTPSNHLQGIGCPKCKGKNKTTESFIEEVLKIHGDKYDYSNVKYNGAFEPVRVICKKHGEFITTPHTLLNGSGCPECGIEERAKKEALTTQEFIEKAKNIYGKKYDYSKVSYINTKTPVCVICPKHGEFYIVPNSHISSKKVGCPKCSESYLETQIRVICEKEEIEYIKEKKFSWLGLQRYDFYLPKYNVAIECQGIQHFEPFFSNDKEQAEKILLTVIKRDELKKQLSEENGVTLLYYIPENLISKIGISQIYNSENIFSKPKELIDTLNGFLI